MFKDRFRNFSIIDTVNKVLKEHAIEFVLYSYVDSINSGFSVRPISFARLQNGKQEPTPSWTQIGSHIVTLVKVTMTKRGHHTRFRSGQDEEIADFVSPSIFSVSLL